MTRFWMVQHLMAGICLLLNVVFDWSLWALAVVSLNFLFTGYQFARSAQRDDTRNRLQVHNLTITGGAA